MVTGNPDITYWIMAKAGWQDRIAHHEHVAMAGGRDGWAITKVTEPMSAFNSRRA